MSLLSEELDRVQTFFDRPRTPVGDAFLSAAVTGRWHDHEVALDAEPVSCHV
jgi:hypothetical protein